MNQKVVVVNHENAEAVLNGLIAQGWRVKTVDSCGRGSEYNYSHWLVVLEIGEKS